MFKLVEGAQRTGAASMATPYCQNSSWELVSVLGKLWGGASCGLVGRTPLLSRPALVTLARMSHGVE